MLSKKNFIVDLNGSETFVENFKFFLKIFTQLKKKQINGNLSHAYGWEELKLSK